VKIERRRNFIKFFLSDAELASIDSRRGKLRRAEWVRAHCLAGGLGYRVGPTTPVTKMSQEVEAWIRATALLAASSTHRGSVLESLRLRDRPVNWNAVRMDLQRMTAAVNALTSTIVGRVHGGQDKVAEEPVARDD
jgi:hypothetical protein